MVVRLLWQNIDDIDAASNIALCWMAQATHFTFQSNLLPDSLTGANSIASGFNTSYSTHDVVS